MKSLFKNVVLVLFLAFSSFSLHAAEASISNNFLQEVVINEEANTFELSNVEHEGIDLQNANVQDDDTIIVIVTEDYVIIIIIEQ